MTEHSPLSLGQLSQSLQQLAGSVLSADTSTNSQMLTQAAAVLVKTYATNQILLIGQRQQLTVDVANLNSILLRDGAFYAKADTTQQTLTLTPAPQLLAKLPLTPQLIDALTKLPELSSQAGTITIATSARVTRVWPDSISVNIHAQQHALAINDTTSFKQGQKVDIEISPQAGRWVAKIVTPAPPDTHGQNTKNSTNVNTNTAASQVLLSRQSATAIKSPTQPMNVNVTPHNLAATVNLSDNSKTNNLVEPNRSTTTTHVAPPLAAVRSIIQSALNQANISLPNKVFTQLSNELPLVQQTKMTEFKLAEKSPELTLSLSKRGSAIQMQSLPADTTPMVLKLDKLQTQRSHELIQQLPAISIKDLALSTDKEPASPLQQVRQNLHTLLRQLQPLQESPASLLRQLNSIIAEPMLDKLPEVKLQLQQIIGQINNSLPQAKEQDAAMLRALLTAPMQPLTPIQLITPPANQGFVAGLVSLLQLSLSARLARDLPAQHQKFSEAIEQLLSGNNKTPPSTRALSDFAQLEQQHQLSKNIARLLANHQGGKMASVEQQLQGQDSLFFAFATGQRPDQQDVELLIRRQQEQQSGKEKDKPKGSRWHLTMKLSLGEIGELLAKATLTNKQLELDFYTSNSHTQQQVMNFMPLLKRRFDALQIEVKRSQCQLGKIPATLKQRPYQLLETKV